MAKKKKKYPSKEKSKEMMRDGTAHGKKLSKKQKGLFGLIAGGGKPYAQEGLANVSGGDPGGGMPPSGQAPQGGSDPNSGASPQQGISLNVAITAKVNGADQPLGNIPVNKPEDVKKLVQVIVGFFQQQGGQPAGQPQGGQPAPQGQPAAQPGQ